LIEIKAKQRSASDSLCSRGETLAMTPDAKFGEQIEPTTGMSCKSCKAIGVPCAVESQATSLRTRPGQKLTLALDGSETAFIVRSGVLMLQVTLPGSARQVTGIFFPGDILRSSFAPPHAEAAIIVVSAGEVWRLRVAALETLAAADPAVRRFLDEAIASRMIREAIHAVALGRFDSEQKVATLLVELALRTGGQSPGGVVFELPFGRKDIADYLGLNPDTLSRVMSRFKAAGLIGSADRGRTVARDFAGLAARSPAAQSLIAMRGARAPEISLQAAL
jgi:CRP/FNR family transcriptional regulator